jgi:hypothetical protein
MLRRRRLSSPSVQTATELASREVPQRVVQSCSWCWSRTLTYAAINEMGRRAVFRCVLAVGDSVDHSASLGPSI